MTSTPDRKPGRTIQSVEIAFAVIDVLQSGNGLGVTEIANELGHSKSTIHSHLQTLEEQRIVARDDDGYRLSLRLLDMANHVREQIDNYDVIRTEVDKLAEETGEIAQFGIREHGKVSYLYKEAGDNAVITASRVGTQQPLHSTSLGKTMLAFLPPEETREYVDTIEFAPSTPKTITDQKTLLEDLKTTRERGYGIDDEENFEGLRCVAAPVTDGETVLGAVSLTGPSSRFTDDRIHGELSDDVMRTANIIELNSKFS